METKPLLPISQQQHEQKLKMTKNTYILNLFRGRIGALTNVVLFIAVAACNALVTQSYGVLVTNQEVANSHPVYILPKGWAFSIWGIIYLLEAIFTIYQALPSKWDEELLRSIRPWVIMSSIFNVIWLFSFGNNLYWISCIFIALYEVALIKLLATANVNYFDKSHNWQHKICVVAGFSVNAGWVFVASLLNININLMEEGYIPSADFAVGCIAVATLFAGYWVYQRCDVFYAFASAWALLGIVSNQGEGTKWGTAEDICTDACNTNMQVCLPASTTSLTPTQGVFYDSCQKFAADGIDRTMISTSSNVVNACYAGVVIVLLATSVAIVNKCLSKDDEEREDSKNVPIGEV